MKEKETQKLLDIHGSVTIQDYNYFISINSFGAQFVCGSWEREMRIYSQREADRYVNPNETPSEKFRRLWDYYRLPVIVFAVIALILSYLLFTLLTKEKHDMMVLYLTEKPANYKLIIDEYGNAQEITGDKTAVSKWESLISRTCRDLNSDGKQVAAVENLYIGDSQDKSDSARDNKEKILTLIRTAEAMLFLCDERGMEYLISIDALEDLSDLSEETEYDGLAVAVGPETRSTLSLGNEKLYLALRSFTGTAAAQSEEKQAAFENAKTVLFELCR